VIISNNKSLLSHNKIAMTIILLIMDTRHNRHSVAVCSIVGSRVLPTRWLFQTVIL